MSDPLGLIGNIGALNRLAPPASRAGQADSGGPGFKEMLQQQIQKVNDLQNEASQATEDLFSGRRNDLENVMIATAKADAAFRTLLAVRNKITEAYDEVKQLRV